MDTTDSQEGYRRNGEGRAGTDREAEAVLDCRILAHQLKLIEAFWCKARQNRPAGLDQRNGFAWGKLEDAILEGGYLALHYLAIHDDI